MIQLATRCGAIVVENRGPRKHPMLKRQRLVAALVTLAELCCGSSVYAGVINATSDFASAFVVGGRTVNNVTIFGDIVQYQHGTNTYARFDDIGRNRWGDYSATTRDPSDSSKFWTIQEWASGRNIWST